MYPKTRNQHDFCYQCYKYGPDLLFGNLMINDKKDEQFTPEKEIMLIQNSKNLKGKWNKKKEVV